MTQLLNIFLVEDDDRDIELITRALKKTDLVTHIDSARDGQEALDYVHCEGRFRDRHPSNPALIILDIKMPKVDGLQVLGEIRRSEKMKYVPVVLLTSSNHPSDKKVAYQKGANAFVVKPFNYQSFAEAARRLGEFWLLVNEQPDEF